jgi:hypothetical protein
VSVLIAALTLVLLAVVVFVVSAPLRSLRAGKRESEAGAGARLQDLEAARAAKYREIRDTELDFRTGKLSNADYHAIDSLLRSEAVEILNVIQRLAGGEPEQLPDNGESEPEVEAEGKSRQAPLSIRGDR